MAEAENGLARSDGRLEERGGGGARLARGLDRINNAGLRQGPGISVCVDLSATPFYLQGSGYPGGRPFPWLVSDFGLVDAIECGIVKIPRLPGAATRRAGPSPKYFRLWKAIDGERSSRASGCPARPKPKPEVVYREAEGALQQIGRPVEGAVRATSGRPTPARSSVPPVLIVVCDNTDIAEVFFRNISGETSRDRDRGGR